MTIGAKIENLRKAAGLSQEQLAELVGVSRQAVSKWETDTSLPDLENVLMLCRAFGVSADELLGTGMAAARKNAPSVNDVVRANRSAQMFKQGWITLIIGVILVFADIIIMYVMQAVDRAGGSWRTNAMDYADLPIMVALFALTACVIGFGAGLMVFSNIKSRIRDFVKDLSDK